MIIERFAPSPTGFLHLGHAYSAYLGYRSAQNVEDKFLLRIEDIDLNRSKKKYENQIYNDLHWLGIKYEEPVLLQSTRLNIYNKNLKQLWKSQHLFACNCTRKDIVIAAAPQENGVPLAGPDGIIYPGTCLGNHQPLDMPQDALRLNIHNIKKNEFFFDDIEFGKVSFTKKDVIDNIGSVVIARKDIGISYHLSVVLDDAFQGITHVTRGADLLEATKIHVILQHLLGLPTPIYRHHRLIRDYSGRRLAKRDESKSIKSYREAGFTPKDIISMFD